MFQVFGINTTARNKFSSLQSDSVLRWCELQCVICVVDHEKPDFLRLSTIFIHPVNLIAEFAALRVFNFRSAHEKGRSRGSRSRLHLNVDLLPCAWIECPDVEAGPIAHGPANRFNAVSEVVTPAAP